MKIINDALVDIENMTGIAPIIMTIGSAKERINALNITKIEHSIPQLFQLSSDKGLIAQFYLSQLPGCCGVCLTTGEWVNVKFRNLGVGTRLSALRKKIALHCEYTVLLCTDVANNIPQKSILKKNGWVDLFRFRNCNTNNLVDISVVSLVDSNNNIILGEIKQCHLIQKFMSKLASFSRAIKWFLCLFTRS